MNKLKKVLLLSGGGLVFAVAISSFFIVSDFKINTSESFPVGIYKVTPTKTVNIGDLIVICPSNTVGWKATYKDYLPQSLECKETHTVSLLKRVVALKGDVVEVLNQVSVNGKVLKNSDVLKLDGKNRPVKSCEGKYLMGERDVWVMSDYNRKSYDSRYFCALSIQNIIGVAKPLIVF